MQKFTVKAKWIIIISGVLICLISIILWVIAEDTVYLSNDGVSMKIRTRTNTVADLFKEVKIKWRPEDIIEPSLPTKIGEGMKIKYIKAVPFDLEVDGQMFYLWSAPFPVREALLRTGLKLNKDDLILPSPEIVIQPHAKIKVVRMAREIKTVKEVLSIQVIRREDCNLNLNETKIIQKGKEGLAEVVYRYIYEEGRFVKKIKLSQKILKPTTPTIIHYGLTNPQVRIQLTSRGHKRWLVREMIATAYYWGPECCGSDADGYTSIGLKAGYGIVAVDPRVIPMRTKLYIEGYGFGFAGDVGGAIKGNRIDLCFDTYREALMYGRRKVRIYILE